VKSRGRRFPVLVVSVILLLLVGSGGMLLVQPRSAPEGPPVEPPPVVLETPCTPAMPPPLPEEAPPDAVEEEPAPTEAEEEPEYAPPEVERTPKPASVVARVVTGPDITAKTWTLVLWKTDGPEPGKILENPDLGGRLTEMEFGLPDGEYRMELVAEGEGTVVRVKREFSVAGFTTDLGEIRLTRYAGIRARVLDVAGQPVTQADVVVVRPEEEPEKARRLAPDLKGYVAYQDLEPDTVHQVVVLGLPERMERSVRTPDKPGETVEAQFTYPTRLVPTTIVFLIDGEVVPVGEIEGLSSELPVARIPVVEGNLYLRLIPGEYRFWTEKREGTLTVPIDECVIGRVELVERAVEEER
jgi:hypothetical protein